MNTRDLKKANHWSGVCEPKRNDHRDFVFVLSVPFKWSLSLEKGTQHSCFIEFVHLVWVRKRRRADVPWLFSLRWRGYLFDFAQQWMIRKQINTKVTHNRQLRCSVHWSVKRLNDQSACHLRKSITRNKVTTHWEVLQTNAFRWCN